MKIYKLFTALLLSLMTTISAYAAPICGSWAENSINNALLCEIVSEDDYKDYYVPITRIEIARIISAAYKNITGNKAETVVADFTDTNEECSKIVASLNIMNGYGDGTFLPDAYTSRQEMSKIILTYKAALSGTELILPENYNCSFKDFDTLSNWAKPYVAKASEENIITGYTDGSFGGLNSVSWQEAIVMIERVSPFKATAPLNEIYTEEFNLKTSIDDYILNISWDLINNHKSHTLTITEQRLSKYENDIPPNEPIILNFEHDNSYSLKVNPNKKYIITISCNGKFYTDTLFTKKLIFEDMEEIFMSYPTTKEEADSLMTEITVPVWSLLGNEKIANSATFKVHNAIAEKVTLIFEEIFSGEEKFPIKDVNAYTWRGGKTEHNGGTAIDINSNENFCIYSDGTTIGSHWSPNQDPYSIKPYGDVVRAFEKYGFTWGGDSWSNPKDYMHFSYLGT